MREEIENKLKAVLTRLCRHFNFENDPENLDGKSEILNRLEVADPEIFNSLKEYFVLFDSYIFIKSDRTLMFKGRDVWKMELDMFGTSLNEANEELVKLMDVKGIA